MLHALHNVRGKFNKMPEETLSCIDGFHTCFFFDYRDIFTLEFILIQ